MGRAFHPWAGFVLTVALATPAAGCSWNWDVKGAASDGATPPVDGGPDADDYCVDGRRFLTLHIDSNEDDGEIAGVVNGGEFYREGEKPGDLPRAIYPGIWANGRAWGFFRFRLPEQLADEAKLLSARIELYGLATTGTDVVVDEYRFLNVMLEDVADSTVPRALGVGENDSPDTMYDGVRERLNQQVKWSFDELSDFKINGWNTSPDLSALVKSLIQEKGPLEADAHMTFWLTNLELEVAMRMELGFEDWSAAADHHGRLVLELDGCE